MKNWLLLLTVVLLCNIVYGQNILNEHNPTRLIVKFNQGSVLYKTLRINSPMDYSSVLKSELVISKPIALSFFKDYKINSIQPAKLTNSLSPLYGGVERIFFLDFESKELMLTAYNKLQHLSDFEYVNYDWKGEVSNEKGINDGQGNVNPDIIPNDPNFNLQWGLKNTGQTIDGIAGTPGADINVALAWDVTTGNANTKVSVLDSGMPLTASEFAGRVLPGYDFANNDNDPTDDNGHGTNVTSVLAATGNNSLGIAGVNWNCKIIPIKILNENNIGYYSWWISGIVMAADSGAKVLNMSVGGSSFSQGLQDAVNYALNSGSIIVACMMNENNEVTFYPAGFNDVISIGALNNTDQRAVPFCWGGGSNYGNHIDFVAPGDWILGLHYQNPTKVSYWCGTSQATPMVSGLISLILGINPTFTLQQIYDRLKLYAHDQIGDPSEDTLGWDKYYGWGRIDAYAVINSITSIDPITVLSSFNLSQNYPNPFNPTTTLSFAISQQSFVSLKVYDVLGKEVATLVNEEKPAGTYKVTFDAGKLSSGVYFYKLQAGNFVEVKKMIMLK